MAASHDPPAPLHPVYAIKLAGTLAPLRPGDTLLGRGSNCDIVVPSEKASRTHAKITVDASGVYLEDLKSTNGVFVNEEQIAGRTRLRLRDTLRIGDATMRLVYFDDMKRTRRGDPLPGNVADEPDAPSDDGQTGHTQRGHAFDVVGPLIDKMLTMGRVDEAERLLRSPIQRVLSHAEQGLPVDEAVTSAAAAFAVRIADAGGVAHWIDLTFRVHSALGRTLPLPVVDELYRVLRSVRGIDRTTLRNYIEQLESRADTMAPTERFALKRIVGLLQIASG